MDSSLRTRIIQGIEASIAVKAKLLKNPEPIAQAAELLAAAYRNGNQAIFFGNGGSAADAQHLAAEMVGRFAYDREPLPALALNTNSSAVTAIGNDYGYDELFVRQLSAHARPGDVAVGLSTSGTSRNVLAAARIKEKLGVKMIALVGANAEAIAPLADVVISVPSTDTPRIQECHILIGHLLCEWIERSMFPR
jgi:D-sedoheptulose 7-phosphate isomerase